MGRTAELPLLLFSSGDAPVEFTAEFTPESPLCFDVRPARGLLPVAPGTAAVADGGGGGGGGSGGGADTHARRPEGRPAAAACGAPITVLYTCRWVDLIHSSAIPFFQRNQHSKTNARQPTNHVNQMCFYSREMGRVMRGRLVVHAAGSQHVYDVVGRLPKYNPPDVKALKSSLDTGRGTAAASGSPAAQQGRQQRMGAAAPAAGATTRHGSGGASGARR
jgi:hypothetical protein